MVLFQTVATFAFTTVGIVLVGCVNEVDYDADQETSTLINNFGYNYREAVSPAFQPRECVFSNRGYDYRGVRHQALGDRPCSSWSVGKDNSDLHQHRGFLHRASLIDGHVGGQSYCRVPINRGWGLTCMLFWPPVPRECTREPPPFCAGVETAECRFTGNGQEYQGNLSRTQTGRTCLPWRTAYEHVKRLIGKEIEHLPFSETMHELHKHFPELREHMHRDTSNESLWWPKIGHNFCRNWYPWAYNGRDNGPYCFVETDHVEGDKSPLVTIESCDVPLCDDRPDACTYVTRGSNGRFDFYLPLPFESPTADNVVRLSIRSWTIEYPIHARFKFVDTTSTVQRGYFFYVGPLDTVASRIEPLTQNGHFIKWRQYSPNKTMAVEWRNIYFRFVGATRTVEFGDVLDSGVLEPILHFGDVQFVFPRFMSFTGSIEATPACKKTITTVSYRKWFGAYGSWSYFPDFQLPNRDTLAFEYWSEISVMKMAGDPDHMFVEDYQHAYKDCKFNYERSRLLVHVPHMCDTCREIVVDGHPFLLHRIPRLPGLEDSPEYEIQFSLRGLIIRSGSPRLFLLHQAGTFPQWTADANRTIPFNWEARWSRHNDPRTPARAQYWKNVDIFGNVDFHLSDPGYIIDFVINDSGEPDILLRYNLAAASYAYWDGRTLHKYKIANSTFFQFNQEMVDEDGSETLVRTKLNRAFLPTLLESKVYKIRVNRQGFSLFFIDIANDDAEIEILHYDYPSIRNVDSIPISKGEKIKQFPYQYQSNVDIVSRFFGITNTMMVNKGRHFFYTVHCLPKHRQIVLEYPDCVLTHDDPKFSGQWSTTKHGFQCARWDDPLVQNYATPNLKSMLTGLEINKKYYDIRKHGFGAYKLLRKDAKKLFAGDSTFGFNYHTMDGLLKLQELAGDKDNYPDGSITSAGNNCRNLGGSSDTGPFCFTYVTLMGKHYPFLWPIPDQCNVPRCHFSACRGTLAGHEYRGPAVSDALFRKCEVWSRDRVTAVYGPLNSDGAADKVAALLDELAGSRNCTNFVLEPSSSDVGGIECLTGDRRRPRAPCHVPICQMGSCTVLVAYDEQRDRQNYLRVLGSDPKMLRFGLRHMSLSPDTDGRLQVEFTDVPSNASQRESLLIDIAFQVQIRYKAKTESQYTTLVYKVFPNLIRVLGLQYLWIGIDKDEVRFGKDKDFRNPLLTAPLTRSPLNDSDVFHFINFRSEDVMALDWGCGERCPVWYVISQSRLYEHHLVPDAPGVDQWRFKLQVSVRWTDDFPPTHDECRRRRRPGGLRLTFSESAFELTVGSGVEFVISQGTAVSVRLVYHDDNGDKKLERPLEFTGPDNDCDGCWTRYDIAYDASQSRGSVSWRIIDAAAGQQIGALLIDDYDDRRRAFLPTAYHVAAVYQCQVPANVVFNCTPPERFAVERVDGGWDGWSPWECSIPCDGGFGVRDRHCRSPPPNFWGDFCEGDAFEMGVCNDYKCGQFNPEMVDRLRDHMRQSDAVTLTRYTGGGVRLTCSNRVATIVRDAMPGIETRWYFNRTTVDMSLWLDMLAGDLYRGSLTTADTGVYICNLVTPAPTRDERTAQMTALVVRSVQPTLRVREGDRLEFPCNIDMVGLVYADLSQRWLRNGQLFQDLGVTSPSDTNLFSETAAPQLAGVWECRVTAEALNLSWTTAWQRVRVLPRRTWLTDFHESIFYRKLAEAHGTRLWLTLAAVACCLGGFCSCYTWMARRAMRREAAEVAAYVEQGDMDVTDVHAAGFSMSDLTTPDGDGEGAEGEVEEEGGRTATSGPGFTSDTSIWESSDTGSAPPPPPPPAPPLIDI